MTFKDAIKAMKQGKKVRHKSWDKKIYLHIPIEYRKMKNPYVYMVVTGQVTELCVLTQSDMISENWEVVE